MENKYNELKVLLSNTLLLNLGKNKLHNNIDEFRRTTIFSCKDVFDTFSSNMKSVLLAVTIPETIAEQRTKLVVYDRFLTEQIILSTPLVTELEADTPQKAKERFSLASENAKNSFFNSIASPEGKRKFWLLTLEFLNSVSNDSFQIASKELINQSTLSVWTVFEVFCRDCFILLLNKKSELVEKLHDAQLLKQRFNLRSIPTERLIEYNYNLSDKMGEILIDNFEFSNLEIIKLVYKQILSSTLLNTKFENTDLWLLYKRRNLIVHKSGIVDNQYLTSTSDNLPVGSKLYVKPTELLAYIELILDLAKEIKQEIEKIFA